MDVSYLLGRPPRITEQRFTRRDTMLYALGVGAGQGSNAGDFAFVYEHGLQALPTMAVVLGYPGFWQMEPQYRIDWKRLLHAEQSISFERALPVEGEVRSELTIDSVIDKGAEKGALLFWSRRLFEATSGDLLATIRQVSFLRGDGGCGSSTTAPAAAPHAIPQRAADAIVLAVTRPEQALIYRLCGDYNPLHADPQAARAAGLEQPILHGLCTYGTAGRVLLRELCDNDPARLKRLDGRFTSPVYPGDELAISFWRESAFCAAYRVDVPVRGVTVINNGYVEFIG